MYKKNIDSKKHGLTIKEKLARLDITDYECTEFGFAQLFCDIYGKDVKYVASTRTFYLYNHKQPIWEVDLFEKTERKVERFLSRDCPQLISKISDRDIKRKYRMWVSKRQNNSTIVAILRIARRKKEIIAQQADFDKASRYFAVKKGVFDMDTNSIVPMRREYFISKCANVFYDPKNCDTTYRDFLLSIFEGDEDMYDYVLRTVGYAMRGEANEHCLFMLYGPTTRNGKSTFVRGIGRFFDGYATSLSEGSLGKIKSDPTSPRPDIAKLQGKRFVSVAELPKKMVLNEAFIKALTGQDTIVARKLYQNDEEEFVNHAVFFLHMNRLPKIEDSTLITSNRIIVIPFNRHFESHEIDVELTKKLSTEEAKSGLLNEIIRVMRKYRNTSIKEKLPSKVKAATKAFACINDNIDDFLSNELVPKYKGWIRKNEIYEAYENYILRRKGSPIDSDAFFDNLEDRQYVIKRRNNGSGVIGYALKNK